MKRLRVLLIITLYLFGGSTLTHGFFMHAPIQEVAGHCHGDPAQHQPSSSSTDCFFSCLEVYTQQTVFSVPQLEELSLLLPFFPCFFPSIEIDPEMISTLSRPLLTVYIPESSPERIGTIRKNE